MRLTNLSVKSSRFPLVAAVCLAIALTTVSMFFTRWFSSDQGALVRFRLRHRLLVFLAAPERLFRRQFFGAHAEIFFLQAMTEFGFTLDFGLLQIKIDEDRNLRAQDQWIDGLEHHVDSPRRIGLEQMRVVAEQSRQEHDGNMTGLLSGTHIGGHFVAV